MIKEKIKVSTKGGITPLENGAAAGQFTIYLHARSIDGAILSYENFWTQCMSGCRDGFDGGIDRRHYGEGRGW